MSVLVGVVVGVFVVLVAIEALAAAWTRRPAFELRDTVANVGVGLGALAISALWGGGSLVVLMLVWTFRLVDLGNAWWVWVLLFFAEDLRYYWFHRAHHRIRVLWASHEPHHSATWFNPTVSLRLGWFTVFSVLPFLAILVLLGFHPLMVLTMQAASLCYQIATHLSCVGRLGPLEHVLVTPSHHRVHHGQNDRYVDRNHGGVLIIWDRLFGTFQAEDEPVIFGVAGVDPSWNPLRVALREYVALGRDLLREGSVGDRLLRLVRTRSSTGPGAAPAPARPGD